MLTELSYLTSNRQKSKKGGITGLPNGGPCFLNGGPSFLKGESSFPNGGPTFDVGPRFCKKPPFCLRKGP